MKPVRIGVGGPVGAGKTQLIERITRALQDEFSMAAITNDIYTIEDAKILAANGVLPLDRIIGIETGGVAGDLGASELLLAFESVENTPDE